MDTKRLVLVSFALLAALFLFGCRAGDDDNDNATPVPEGPTGEITITVVRPDANPAALSEAKPRTMDSTRYLIDSTTQWFRIRAKLDGSAPGVGVAFAEINYTLCTPAAPCTAVLAVSPGTYTVGVLGIKSLTPPYDGAFGGTSQLLQYGEATGVSVVTGASTQATVTMADSSMVISPPPAPVIWGSLPAISLHTTNVPDDIEGRGASFRHAVDGGASFLLTCGGAPDGTIDPVTFMCAATSALPGSGSTIQFGGSVNAALDWAFTGEQFLIGSFAVFSAPLDFIEGSGIGIVIQ